MGITQDNSNATVRTFFLNVKPMRNKFRPFGSTTKPVIRVGKRVLRFGYLFECPEYSVSSTTVAEV